MDKKLLPSERLKARLAAHIHAPATHDPARRYIDIAEATFADPLTVISAKWTRQEPDSFTFSRPAHEFSEFEVFAFKLVMILAGLGAVGRSEAEHIIATITYAGGKAKIRRDARSILAEDFPEYHQLSTFGLANQVPPAFT